MKVFNKIKNFIVGKEEVKFEPWEEVASALDTVDLDYIIETERHLNKNLKNTRLFGSSSKMIDSYLEQDTMNLFMDAPLYLKVNFVLHALNLTRSKGNVDWTRITNFLYDNPVPYDYNIDLPRMITSINELSKLSSKIFMALRDIEPYHQALCKSCNKPFTLKYAEMKFYVEKDLFITKKCSNCRKQN